MYLYLNIDGVYGYFDTYGSLSRIFFLERMEKYLQMSYQKPHMFISNQ